MGNDSFFISTDMWRPCDEVKFHFKKGKESNYTNFIAGLSVCIQNLNLLNMKKEWQTYRFHDDFAFWNLVSGESFKTSKDKFHNFRRQRQDWNKANYSFLCSLLYFRIASCVMTV
jgi:hypothetical protein